MIIDFRKYQFPKCEWATAFVEFIHLCDVTYAVKVKKESKFTLFVRTGETPYDVFDNSLFDKTIPLLKRNKNFLFVEDSHEIKIFNLNYISQITWLQNKDNALSSSFAIRIETPYYEIPLDFYLNFNHAIAFLETLAEVNKEIETDSILKDLLYLQKVANLSHGI